MEKEFNFSNYEGLNHTYYSDTISWDAGALEPKMYRVRVTVHNISNQDSTSVQTRVFNLVKSNAVPHPEFTGVNSMKGNEVVLRLTLPSGTPPGGAPIDHFTIYRGTNSGFTLDESHKIADNIRISERTTLAVPAQLTKLSAMNMVRSPEPIEIGRAHV